MLATHAPSGPPSRRIPAVAPDFGGGELRPQVGFEGLDARAQADAADPPWRRGDEQPAERGGDNGVGDAGAGRAAPVRGGRHAELGVRPLVDAAGRAVAGLIQRGADASPGSQPGFEAVQPARVAVLAGADAQDAPEGAQQLVRRRAHAAGEPREGRGLVRMRVDQAADLAHQREPGIGFARVARPAAAAGAEARELRRLWGGKKRHLLASRAPTRARRAAVDPGRVHGVHERAVVAAVAREHDAPEIGGRGKRDGGRVRAGHVVETSAAWMMRLSAIGR